ncbi:DEAD/DEAH box helicase family protein, partial [Pedobacter sp.]|nr:DEAD/DEAH box helicase family protein [Candidatus Saccharibacteria bacterium]
MHYYLITPLRIVHGSRAELTYESEDSVTIGTIVLVPVGKVSVPGIVIGAVAKPTFATKPLASIIDPTPLPLPLLQLARWMSEYYATHPVTVWQTLLPRGVQKKRRLSTKSAIYPKRSRTTIVLNNEQRTAINAILQHPTGTSLLHGVTSSGKTQLYIELAKKATNEGRSVIILVPEIALTSQIIAEFTPDFPNLVVTHSTMTEADRHTVWLQMLHATTPQVVIGPRSALFSPVPNLGLIVIDECHEPSFKQEQSPRYSALRTASKLATFSKARLVLGSA